MNNNFWAIKEPPSWQTHGLWDGDAGVVFRTRSAAIASFESADVPWRHWYRQGWRCVKVEVKEQEK